MIRSLIAACDDAWVIGVDGAMPWSIPSEARWFRSLTWGCPVIMGSGTWRSLRGPLPGRFNVVVSSSMPRPEGAAVARSLSEAWSLARDAAGEAGAHSAYVIGGEALYRLAALDVDEAVVTRVRVAADVGRACRVSRFPWGAVESRPKRVTRVVSCRAEGETPWEQTTYRFDP